MKRTWVSVVVGSLCSVMAGGVIAQDKAIAGAEKAALAKPAAVEFTPRQYAVLAEKLRLVSGIVARMEPQARADGLAPGWRQSAMSELYMLSNDTLANMGAARSFADLPNAIAHAQRVTPKALGSQTEDVVYTPITPCRYIDTRDVGGKISGTRSYDLDLNSYTLSGIKCAASPYSTFGGTLAALAVNLAIVDPSSAPGFATIVPTGAATNVALMNWYASGPTVQASNAAIVTIDQAIGPANEIDIHTSGAVHAIVDIFGAFRASGATALECQDVVATGSIPANGTLFLSTAACPTGHTRTSGAQCQHQGGYDQVWLSKTGNEISGGPTNSGANAAACAYRNLTASAITAWANVTCCRIPGR